MFILSLFLCNYHIHDLFKMGKREQRVLIYDHNEEKVLTMQGKVFIDP